MNDNILQSVLASFKDASVKSQIDSQPKTDFQGAATLSTFEKGVRNEIMKGAEKKKQSTSVLFHITWIWSQNLIS